MLGSYTWVFTLLYEKYIISLDYLLQVKYWISQ